MATLEKIRNKAGLLVTAIGVALFAFIVGDLFSGGQTLLGLSRDKVVDINGETVSYEEFQKNIYDLTEIYKMQSGDNSLSAEISQQINQQVYDNLIREALITEEAGKIGMIVSKEELADMVSGDHIAPALQQMPFFRNQETGQFDKNLLLNFLNAVISIEEGVEGANASAELRQARQFWMFWEKNIKKSRLEEKYTTLLSKAIMPNSLEVNSQFEGGKTSVDFAYVRQSLSTVPDSTIAISKKEITEFYNKHKDSRYKQGETRSVKYFAVDIVPSADDYKNTEEEITKVRSEFATTNDIADMVNLNSDVPYVDAYQAVRDLDADMQQFVETSSTGDVYGPYLENDVYRMYRIMGKTVAPDSVKARHIMISNQNEVAALSLADSLLTVLRKGGDFAALAEEFSIDRNSAVNGGDLGWFTEVIAVRNVGQDFKNACFAAKPKTYFTTRTNYGVHVVEVTETTKNVAKANVAEYALSVSPSNRTFQSIYSEINGMIANNQTLEQFQQAASEKGYNLITNSKLASDEFNLGTIVNARQPIRWAFTNKPGAISEIFEVDNKFVVMALYGETPAGYTPLDQVENSIKFELQREKKGATLVAELKAKNLTSLDAYAKEMGSRVDTAKFVTFNTSRISGLGIEPVLSGSAPFAPVNVLSTPLAGNNSVFVYNVVDKTESTAAFNAETEKESIERSYTYRLMYQSLDVLKNHSEIKDYRINFY